LADALSVIHGTHPLMTRASLIADGHDSQIKLTPTKPARAGWAGLAGTQEETGHGIRRSPTRRRRFGGTAETRLNDEPPSEAGSQFSLRLASPNAEAACRGSRQ
jgi:hypothetical protein